MRAGLKGETHSNEKRLSRKWPVTLAFILSDFDEIRFIWQAAPVGFYEAIKREQVHVSSRR